MDKQFTNGHFNKGLESSLYARNSIDEHSQDADAEYSTSLLTVLDIMNRAYLNGRIDAEAYFNATKELKFLHNSVSPKDHMRFASVFGNFDYAYLLEKFEGEEYVDIVEEIISLGGDLLPEKIQRFAEEVLPYYNPRDQTTAGNLDDKDLRDSILNTFGIFE